jgi:hypothetical protein
MEGVGLELGPSAGESARESTGGRFPSFWGPENPLERGCWGTTLGTPLRWEGAPGAVLRGVVP